MKDTGGKKCILFKDTNHDTLEEAMAYIIIISITYKRESNDAVLALYQLPPCYFDLG